MTSLSAGSRFIPASRPLVSLVSLASLISLAACGGDQVTSRVELVDKVSEALTSDAVLTIKGTYGPTCTQRSGAWAIAVNGYQFASGETALTVIQGDVGCTLAVTAVTAGATATPKSFQPAAPFTLAPAFATRGVPFLLGGEGSTQFFANFRIQPDLKFDSDFVVQMVYSDDVKQTDLSNNSTFIVDVSTATAGVVPAPTSALALSTLGLKVDAHNIVKSTSGAMTLTQGSIVAESYVIDFDTLGAAPSYATVEAAFNAPGKVRVPLTATTTSIPAADLNTIGLDLSSPKKRSVIVANIENGVNSYQLFQITLNKP